MTALYNLADQYLALAEKLADADFDAATIADTIEASGINDEIATKAQALEYVARMAEQHNDAIDAEIVRLTELKKHRAKVADGVREYLLTNMQRMGIQKIDSPLFTLQVQKNPPAVEIYDSLSIPSEFMVQPEPPPARPDKKAIAAALKAGKEVTGAKLVQTERLKIK